MTPKTKYSDVFLEQLLTSSWLGITLEDILDGVLGLLSLAPMILF
jgi:hypothetical protein